MGNFEAGLWRKIVGGLHLPRQPEGGRRGHLKRSGGSVPGGAGSFAMAASVAAPRVLLAPCKLSPPTSPRRPLSASAAPCPCRCSCASWFPVPVSSRLRCCCCCRRHFCPRCLSPPFLAFASSRLRLPACFVVAPDGCLLELHWSKQRHTAWFIANSVCADGSLYLATPVDPLFAILPILEQLRMKKGDDMGRFRSLDDIVSVDGYPSYECLLPYLQRSLEIICESREVEEVKFYRLDDSKVIAWLLCKVTRLTEALKTSSSLLNGLHPKERDLYVIKLLGEYLKMDFWESSICKHMGVDIDALKTARVSFTPSMPAPSRTPEWKVNKLNGPAAKKAALSKNSKQSGASPKITSYFTSNR